MPRLAGAAGPRLRTPKYRKIVALRDELMARVNRWILKRIVARNKEKVKAAIKRRPRFLSSTEGIIYSIERHFRPLPTPLL